MITVPELVVYFKSIDNTIDDELLQAFAAELIDQNKAHPLPSIKYLSESPEAKEFFSKMLTDFKEKMREKIPAEKKLVEAPLEKLNEVKNLLERIISAQQEGKEAPEELVSELDIMLINLPKTVKTFGLARLLKQNMEDGGYPGLLAFIIVKRDAYVNKQSIPALTYSYFVQEFPDKKDALVAITLPLHCKQYEFDVAQTEGPIHFIHFYQCGSPKRSSEALETYHSDDENDDHISFDKTNHGIGTGVYGVGKLSEEIMSQIKSKNNYAIVTLDKPLRLNAAMDEEGRTEAVKLSALSKDLQYLCDAVKQSQKESRSSGETRLTRAKALAINLEVYDKALRKHAAELSQFEPLKHLSEEEIYKIIKTSLVEFLEDSRKPNAMVAMPINYVVKKLGFDGVVSEDNDRFNRGLIAFDDSKKFNEEWARVKIKPMAVAKENEIIDPFGILPSELPKGDVGLLYQNSVNTKDITKDYKGKREALTGKEPSSEKGNGLYTSKKN